MKNKVKLKKALSALCILLIWCLIWLGASAFAKHTGYGLLVPSPREVLSAFAQLVRQKSFYVSCGASLLRVLIGWAAGLTAGTLLAVITSKSRPLSAFFTPAMHVIKATPVASFIILALVLMNKSRVPAFTGFLMSLPIVWANVSAGLLAPDKALLEMADAFGMSRMRRLKYIRFPALSPYLTAAATTSMGLTWKACIAAEVICRPADSIGAGIYNAKVYLETPSLFAWTLTVILLSMLLEHIIKAVITKRGLKK